MVPEVRQALEDLVLADVWASTIGVGSTTSWLVLGSSEAADWEVGDMGRLTSSGAATSENDRAVFVVQELDLVLDKIRIWPTLPAAPVSGETAHGGTKSWLRYVSATDPGFNYFRSPQAADVLDLFDDVEDSRVVVGHGDPDHVPELFTRIRSSLVLFLWSRDPAWLEGFAKRVVRLLHHRREDLSLSGRDLWELNVQVSELGRRRDLLHERILAVELVSSEILS